MNDPHPSPRLTVVLVHYRAPHWCGAAIRSVLASRGVDVSVLVVDNSGELEPPSEARARVRVLRPEANLGYAGGADLGLLLWLSERPAEDLVLVASHDLEVAEDGLAALLAAAEANPEAGVFGPRYHDGQFRSVGRRYHPPRGSRLARSEEIPDDGLATLVDADILSGTCLLLRRALLEGIGGFDTRFGSYTEDTDLCLRAREAGWRVVTVPTATASGRGSVATDKDARWRANWVLLTAKHHGPVQAFVRVAAMVAELARVVVVAAVKHQVGRRRFSIEFRLRSLVLVARAPDRLLDFVLRPTAGQSWSRIQRWLLDQVRDEMTLAELTSAEAQRPGAVRTASGGTAAPAR